MQSQLITFEKGANSDDEERAIGPGFYRRAYHLRSGLLTGSNQFARESYPGNLQSSNTSLPAGTNVLLGMTDNVNSDAIMLFYYNSNSQHTIWLWNISTSSFTKVVQSSFLNFKATDWIFHSFVNANVLYWTVGRLTSFLGSDFSEPKQVDIKEAIAFTAGLPSKYTVFSRRTFDFVKWPPPFGPAVNYDTDTNQEANFLYGKMYKFRYRYIYLNNEVSALSPTSKLPLPTQSEFVEGRNWANTQADNVLEVVIETGPDIVKRIEVAVSVNDGPFKLFKTLDKAALSISNNTTYQVNYYGNEALLALPLTERNYDAVPIVSKCMEFLSPTQQVSFTNFVEGYDKIAVSITPSVVAREIEHRKFQSSRPVLSAISSAGLRIFFSIGTVSDIFVGLTYIIPLFDLRTITFEITQDVYDSIVNAVDPTQEFFEQIGEFIATEAGTTGNYTTTPVPSYEFLIWPFYGSLLGFAFDRKVLTIPQVGLFKGAVHPFGIQYYDRANRDGTVITVPVMSLYVPFCTEQDKTGFTDPDNPYVALARMAITNQPPEFATHYQFVKQRPPVAGFQQRSVVRLQTDVDNLQLLKLSLDGYYETELGANINHNIQVGDVVRICRGLATTGSGGTWGDYVASYVELQVMRYDPAAGTEGEAIWVPSFDWEAILGGPTAFESFLIEIYTPSPLTENAPWHEISEEFLVIDPHTATRRHQGTTISGGYTNGTSPVPGTGEVEVVGDYSYVVDYVITLNGAGASGVVTSAVFSGGSTVIQFSTLAVFPATGTWAINLSQNLNDNLPAIVNCEYGDVYTRPRLMNTGFTVAPEQGYYPIDDFYYSDYYISNFNSIGRIAIELSDARQVNLRAATKHGGAFINMTETNNLCRFDPGDQEAYKFMDDQFGEVVSSVLVGYTLKCLQARKENSLYVNAAFGVLPGGSTQAGFTPQSQTWGAWNPAESDYGCIHPNSVQVVEGDLFYFDYYNGVVVRSQNNGQQDITDPSRFKYRERMQSFKTVVDGLGSDAWVSSYFDPGNKEYALFAHRRSNGTAMQGHVFRYDRQQWDHETRYAVFWSKNLGRVLISSAPVSNNQIFVHDKGAENTFYGVQYASEIWFVFNQDYDTVKKLLSIMMKTNARWNITQVACEAQTEYTAMDSEISALEWDAYEGYITAEFNRDKLNVVPQLPQLATTQLALVNGRELRANSALIVATCIPSPKVKIFSATVSSTVSAPKI
jgi:hypothetical protein